MSNIKITIVYIGAPQAADYEPTTKHLETFEAAPFLGAAFKTWRKVEITNDDYRTRYQRDRYRSFLGGCPTLDDPREFPIGTGRQAPSNC
ncbi:MAG: hypothetical protein UY48_C0006G0050 [Candidatus Gottesmanbacteria bacterium GW2011_GWB1_49_7]|uniref:Uncharacterized protein n=1 Tax=Candidatus Gottesmanbacteria bacterium GW2011_GWB1_49_7 TaxID=1618448 RepID=A0A0G1YDE1_9BACT|nr:MAG: hypothetical protein UY48_C0006G0050 [Candidatus Gottesmanbacteria bacterium GW2011_GWB1_49_7]